METDAERASALGSIEISSSFADQEWRDYVIAAPDAVPAHVLGWRNIIADVFGYEPIYRIARRDGKLCGILPAFLVRSALLGRHIISVPFLNSGGISVSDNDAFRPLLTAAQNAVNQYEAKHFELRCGFPPPEGLCAREHKVRILLDLPRDPDDLWKSLRSEIRNRTKHARNAGLTVEFNSHQIREFYSVFAANMRDIGVPVHPRRFFEAVLDQFSDCSELVVVKHESQVIGGAILLAFRDTLEVPWISCSRAHFNLCPNNILYWEIMRQACERGFKVFDFGRSSPNTGPATFKLRWGARTSQLYWHYILSGGTELPGETGTSNPKFQLASNVWSKLPCLITNAIGPRLITHLPG